MKKVALTTVATTASSILGFLPSAHGLQFAVRESEPIQHGPVPPKGCINGCLCPCSTKGKLVDLGQEGYKLGYDVGQKIQKTGKVDVEGLKAKVKKLDEKVKASKIKATKEEAAAAAEIVLKQKCGCYV